MFRVSLVTSHYESDHQFATRVFNQSKGNYHPIARQSITEITKLR
nr:leukotriene A4 hydrolase C-terminal domain-containing protein [Acinetobacter baumannii]EKW7787083.1 leukotriene A4 hydrolase C-terminal domain-containing protein [Acinetobacter baumannii]